MMQLLALVAVVYFTAAFAPSVDIQQMPDLVAVQVPAGELPSRDPNRLYTPLDRYVDGARIVLIPGSGAERVVLTADFAAACDPEVSFDGNTVLFAGKRAVDDHWHIWRMNADGSGKVQVTRGDADNITPAYAGNRFYLNDPQPTPQIIFAGTEHGWSNEADGGPAFSLYGIDLSGEVVHRLTFNLNSDWSPDVLPTGRIVFSSWQQYGQRYQPDGLFALMGINIDGTDLMPFYGNHEMPRYKDMVHVSDFDDRVYFIESDRSVWLGGGDIAFVSRRRPLHSYFKLSHEPHGVFHSPAALPGGGLIASYRAAAPSAVFAIYHIQPESGERQDMVFEEEGWHSIDAQALTPRPAVKGRSNWLIPGSTTGVFYSLNSYRTNLADQGTVSPGTVKHVRVIEGIPQRSHETLSAYVSALNRGSHSRPPTPIFGMRRLLGVAPVAADGSFHIRVPAETPITFQLLDENYLALRTQRAWTWVIGNENRGCIGCHEDRELSPPNKMTEAIIKPPVELTLPPARRRTVDFRHQIAPIIESRCTTGGCHADGQSAPRLTNAPGDPEISRPVHQTLLSAIQGRPDERYVVPGNAKESPLVWLLFGAGMG
ncbi:MAG: hypothetical protein JSW71_03610, partial [Gemmatimonadota bacterium]